ncbi:MAG: carboxypeptidase-like regulatory domain-containing protein [Thermoanaerobaculia bacterium]
MARRHHLLSLTLPLLLVAGTPAASAADGGGLAGQVTTDSGPLASTLVYAYQLADLELTRSVTDSTGRFLFEELPAGLYKIIAFKPGFVPTVVRLARGSAAVEQFLEVQLEASPPGFDAEQGFWSVREQIPPDVLREMLKPQPEEEALAARLTGLHAGRVAPVRGTMTVLTGMEQGPRGESAMTRGHLDLATQVRDLTFGLTGDVRLLGDAGIRESTTPLPTGVSNAFALEVRNEADTAVVVSSKRDRLESPTGDHMPIDLQNLQVRWSQAIGSEGQSEFVARYTAEENFYRRGLTTALTLPQGSQSWYVEGNYTTPLTERTTVQAGVRYREHATVYTTNQLPAGGPALAESRVDLYGLGGVRMRPGTLLEYGMVSSLEDGQLAFAPRVGTVLDLGNDWQASAVASHKLDDGDPLTTSAVVATHYEELNGCNQVEEYCYQIALSRQQEDGDGFSLAATDRRFSEALRLYFDDNFFRHLDSLYLVDGDRLPEVRFTLTRRLGPSILARFTASGGSGGGGETGIAGRWRWQQYENRAQFLVTSVETRFERTDTGVVLRFQQLSQELQPISHAGVGLPARQGEVESLQLLLSQDLNALLQLAAQWAVELDLELSRGDLNQVRTVDASEFYRRFTGGIAVRF